MVRTRATTKLDTIQQKTLPQEQEETPTIKMPTAVTKEKTPVVRSGVPANPGMLCS